MYPVVIGKSFIVAGREHEGDPEVETTFTSSAMGTIMPGEKRKREYAGQPNQHEEEPRRKVMKVVNMNQIPDLTQELGSEGQGHRLDWEESFMRGRAPREKGKIQGNGDG